MQPSHGLSQDEVERLVLESVEHAHEDFAARRLIELARRHSATLVTTGKDMARLAGAEGPCRQLAQSTRVLPVRLALADADAELLMSLVASALKAQRG